MVQLSSLRSQASLSKNVYFISIYYYMKFETIKDRIKNGDQYFLYNLKPDKPSLIAKGKTKTEVKQQLKIKVNKNPEKYSNALCVLMYFEFRVPDNRFTFGDLLIHLHNYKITETKSIRGERETVGYVYFEKEFLEEEGFSYTYLRNIIYLYKLNKIRFNPLGQPGYENLEIRIEQALRHYEKLKK